MKSCLIRVMALGMIGLLIIISGCYRERVIVEERSVYVPAPSEPGPPPWAPAHGHRAKRHYYYYPESHVYFDVGRSLYFYYSGGGWQASVSLLSGIHISAGEYVCLDMDVDRPYLYHSDVEKRYPPGQLKKKGKEKGKKWD